MSKKFHIAFRPHSEDYACKNITASSAEEAVQKLSAGQERRTGRPLKDVMVLRHSPQCNICGSKTISQ